MLILGCESGRRRLKINLDAKTGRVQQAMTHAVRKRRPGG